MKKYVVGGAVRDILMGVEPKDIDFVLTGTTPEHMLAMGFKQVGADFPVFLDEHGNEHALARTERKTGEGYNGFETFFSPDVTIEEDLARRDLTINAMAQDEDGKVFDPFGGQEDIKAKVLRHTTAAFVEDPVRVLRLARFHARFGPDWLVHPSTEKLCREMTARGDLDHLTKERVLKELEKALGETYPDLFFSTLDSFGALVVLFPELGELDAFVNHLESGTPGKAKMQYAFLSMAMANPEEFEDRLNVSNDFTDYRKMAHELWVNFTEHPVDTLYAMDAYRRQDLAVEVLKDLNTGVLEVFHKTKKLGFDNLSDEEKSTMRGPDIGKAIRKMRKEAV